MVAVRPAPHAVLGAVSEADLCSSLLCLFAEIRKADGIEDGGVEHPLNFIIIDGRSCRMYRCDLWAVYASR